MKLIMKDGKGGKIELWFITYPLKMNLDTRIKISFLYEKIVLMLRGCFMGLQ